MNATEKLLGGVFAICLLLCMLITAVEIVVYRAPGYFEREYEKHEVLAEVHMEMDDLLEVTDHMMAYLRGAEADLQIEAVVDGKTRPFFSRREIAHMEDVKGLFLGGLFLRRMAFVCGILAGIFLIKRKRLRLLLRSVACGTAAVFGACGLIGILAAMDFTRYFTVFHHIFFDNDLWLLDPRTDLLINIVPEPFFVDTALYIGLLFAAVSALIFGGCLWGLRRIKGKSEKEKQPVRAA